MPALDQIKIEWDDEDRPLITVKYADDRDDSVDADPEEFLEDFTNRLGDDSAKFLQALLTANGADGPVALADLATRVGVDKKKIDAWNRALGRSLKAVVREYGFLRKDHDDGTSQLFDFVWDNDGNQWLYAIPKDFRPILERLLSQH